MCPPYFGPILCPLCRYCCVWDSRMTHQRSQDIGSRACGVLKIRDHSPSSGNASILVFSARGDAEICTEECPCISLSGSMWPTQFVQWTQLDLAAIMPMGKLSARYCVQDAITGNCISSLSRWYDGGGRARDRLVVKLHWVRRSYLSRGECRLNCKQTPSHFVPKLLLSTNYRPNIWESETYFSCSKQ